MTSLVVMGHALLPDGSASPTLKRRLALAHTLYSGGGYDQLILCGGRPQNGVTEAQRMREHLLEKGLSHHDLTLEDRSRFTIENALHVREITDDVAVVTTAYLRPRAKFLFNNVFKYDVPMFCAPTQGAYEWKEAALQPLGMAKAWVQLRRYGVR